MICTFLPRRGYFRRCPTHDRTVYKQSFCLHYQLNDMHYLVLVGTINDLTKHWGGGGAVDKEIRNRSQSADIFAMKGTRYFRIDCVHISHSRRNHNFASGIVVTTLRISRTTTHKYSTFVVSIEFYSPVVQVPSRYGHVCSVAELAKY